MNIIEKCIEELRKPKPNKQYVLGMLEAMVDMDNRVPEKPTIIFKEAPIVTTTDPTHIKLVNTAEDPDIFTPVVKAAPQIIPRGLMDVMNPPPEMRLN